jgi:hypothetical protein
MNFPKRSARILIRVFPNNVSLKIGLQPFTRAKQWVRRQGNVFSMWKKITTIAVCMLDAVVYAAIMSTLLNCRSCNNQGLISPAWREVELCIWTHHSILGYSASYGWSEWRAKLSSSWSQDPKGLHLSCQWRSSLSSYESRFAQCTPDISKICSTFGPLQSSARHPVERILIPTKIAQHDRMLNKPN